MRRDDSDELGSLAQTARHKSLKQARVILIVVGVLTLLVNFFLFANAEREVREVIEAEKKQAGPGAVFDPAELKKQEESLVRVVRLIYGGMMFLGVVFVGLGVAVYKAPVPCTVTGLVLYLAGNAAFAALDPMNLLRGFIIKIIIIVLMVKAVQAAAAYQREVRAAREERRRRDEFDESDKPDDFDHYQR